MKKNNTNVCIVTSTLHSNSYKNTVITFWAACLPNWGKVLAQLGQGAYPTGARCLPLLGRIAVRHMPNIFIL